MTGTIKTTALPNAGVLTGTERIALVVGSTSKQATTRQLADLVSTQQGGSTTRPIVVNTIAELKALAYGVLLDGQQWMTLGYYYAADLGGLNGVWNASSTAPSSYTVFIPDGAPSVGRFIANGQTNVISARKHGMKADSSYNIAPVMADLWLELKASETTANILQSALYIEPGRYYTDTSINWSGDSTTFSAWNTHIVAMGAHIVGRCAGYAVLDMTGVRGIRMHGMSVTGDQSNMPSTALLVGPRLEQACGNNYFYQFVSEGFYSKAAVANIGSETTEWEGCFFINQNTDLSANAYIGDGANLTGLTSLYASIRAPGTAVSFSRNKFILCRFFKVGGGECVLLDTTFGWDFDGGYNATFSGSNFRVRASNAGRTSDLSINMLCETAQSPGVDYVVTFEVPNIATAVNGLRLKVGTPHASDAIFRCVADSSNNRLTSGGMALSGLDVNIGATFGGATPFMFEPVPFAGYNPWTYAQGSIRAPADILNLGTPRAYYGVVYTDDFANLVSKPVTPNSSCVVYERSGVFHTFGAQRIYGDIIASDDIRNLRRTALDWAANRNYVYGDVRRGSFNQRLYRVTNAGGLSSVIPSQTSGTVTGADGIEWTVLYVDEAGSVIDVALSNTGFQVLNKLLIEDFNNPGTYVQVTAGSGTPEGLVTATVGLHIRTDGGNSTTLYVHPNSAGTSNTGWVAK